VYLITQALQQPLSEIPNWDALPFDVLIGVLEHKRRESEQVAQKMPKQDEFDFEWHDPEVRL